MALKLKIDKTQILGLISSIQKTYKQSGYVSVKEVSPYNIIKDSGVPPTGIIASNIMDWLVKKGYLSKKGGRGRALLSYKWCDNIYDPETITSRYIQFINSIQDTKSVDTFKPVDYKPDKFDLLTEVFMIHDNEIRKGRILGIRVSEDATDAVSYLYSIRIFDYRDPSSSQKTEREHKDLFTSIDSLLTEIKSRYEKSITK